MGETNVPLDRRIAADLLSIGAVSFSPERPYTWASGLRSPVYCDNRLTLGYPAVRRAVCDGFVAALSRHALSPAAVVGTATAGIPHAAWLAERLDLPMAYVRSKPKEHGRGNQIEGHLEYGQEVVVIEDLVSTGLSSVGVVRALGAAGLRVRAVLAIFSYELPEAAAAFADAGVPLHTLTSFGTLLSVAQEQGLLDAATVASLQAWRRDPRAWSAQVEG